MDDILGSLKKLKEELNNLEDITHNELKIGDICYVSLSEDDGLKLPGPYKTKLKYFVIIGFTDSGKAIGALLINSNIDYSNLPQALLDCQYPLHRTKYPHVLSHPYSWLDCSELFELNINDMKQRGALKKGSLNSDDLSNVLETLRETDVIDNITKRKFGLIP